MCDWVHCSKNNNLLPMEGSCIHITVKKKSCFLELINYLNYLKKGTGLEQLLSLKVQITAIFF